MRRTVPLIITFVVGFVLIVAFFIPQTEGWGEVAGIWFDILAAIAFILGGGNLLKMHLKKISDRAPGRGYSVITIASFLLMLLAGLFKWGAPPAVNQEYFGEAFAHLPLEEFFEYAVPGQIPEKPAGQRLPASVQRQIRQQDGSVQFIGWMTERQRDDLLAFKRVSEWSDTVDALFEIAQPPEELEGRIRYYADREMLSVLGHMTNEFRATVDGLSEIAAWQNAVGQLYVHTQGVYSVDVDPASVPPGFNDALAKRIGEAISFNNGQNTLQIQGPMSSDQRDQLIRQFPRAIPLSADARTNLLNDLQQRGTLSNQQQQAIDRFLNTLPSPEQLQDAADPQEQFNERQVEILLAFVDQSDSSPVAVDGAVSDLRAAGELTDEQEQGLREFVEGLPSRAVEQKDVFLVLLAEGPVTAEQREYLLSGFQNQLAWRNAVWALFDEAHDVKYPWSGDYVAEGSVFWWLYEYAFKPLTATMFAMLAFYVASAAFRAFRAKNLAAILLLGTAFVILLGRTFAGVWATSWLPESGMLSYLRIENVSITIMSVFTTAGNRAIMIGIALGIVSASLKVLLGIDRSYLGSGEE